LKPSAIELGQSSVVEALVSWRARAHEGHVPGEEDVGTGVELEPEL
jgi:hypothetical protein